VDSCYEIGGEGVVVHYSYFDVVRYLSFSVSKVVEAVNSYGRAVVNLHDELEMLVERMQILLLLIVRLLDPNSYVVRGVPRAEVIVALRNACAQSLVRLRCGYHTRRRLGPD